MKIATKIKAFVILLFVSIIVLVLSPSLAFADDERNDALCAFMGDVNQSYISGGSWMTVHGTQYAGEEPCSVHIDNLSTDFGLNTGSFVPTTGVLCLNTTYNRRCTPHHESWLCWVDPELRPVGAAIGYRTHLGMLHQDKSYPYITKYSQTTWLPAGCLWIANNGTCLFPNGDGTNTYAQNCLWGVRPEELKGTETNTVRTIVKVDSTENSFDNTSKGVVWNFEHPCTSYNYTRTTPISQMGDTNNISATRWKITQTKYYQWQWNGSTLVKNYYNTEYTCSVNQYEKTIQYNATQPSFSPEKYTPLNLNRENVDGIAGDSHATSADISGYQIGDTNVVGKIDGDTTTTSGVSDNSYIPGLDTNNDIPFTLKFNNKWYGLDASKDWANRPPWDTGSQEMNSGESYAKGLNDSISSGNNDRFRWNLFFNGGVTDIYSGRNLTSLYDLTNGGEYPTGVCWESEYAPSTNNWSNTFGARAIYQGTFGTTNAYTSTSTKSNYPNWWNLIWQVGRYYEYGIHYEGEINTTGIQQPHQASYKNITTEFNIDGDSVNGTNSLNTDGYNQRGLYVALGQTYQENPLLTGKWQINTMAGDIN